MKEMFAVLLLIVTLTIVSNPEKLGQWWGGVQRGFHECVPAPAR